MSTVPVGVGFGIRDAASARAVAAGGRRGGDRHARWCSCWKAEPRDNVAARPAATSSPASAARWIDLDARSTAHELARKTAAAEDPARPTRAERRSVPEGLWIKCPSCETVLYKTDLEQNLNVCPKCDHHHRIGARARLDAFLDPEGRYEIGQEVLPVDALKFKDSKKYPERLKDALEATGETDALVVDGRRGDERAAGGGLLRVRLHGRLDGLGGRRALRARRRDRASSRRCRSSASPPPAARACRRAC